MAKFMENKELVEKMESMHIDINRTEEILDRYNDGEYANIEPIQAKEIPSIDGKNVLDMETENSWKFPLEKVKEVFDTFEINLSLRDIGRHTDEGIEFKRKELKEIGIRLFPYVSYGVLNGGSATSYADNKKNKKFNEDLFNLVQKEFTNLAALSRGRAKGLTPAYVNPDGTPGLSFLQLKMRALLIQALEYQVRAGEQDTTALYPMFQMTSVYNNEEVHSEYEAYADINCISDVVELSGIPITRVETGIQPMLAAFTHSKEGPVKNVFTKAHGKENTPLALPGGHGQNFSVLKNVYKRLYEQGKRFVYLGNVDNLGFTVDPVGVAMLALSGKEAAFEFSFKTPVDVKGGVLVRDQNEKFNCADIGPAISKEAIAKEEESGKQILFNCATGLFDLEYLIQNIDRIIEQLPVRFTDQDKDVGQYSQAEQITWEVLGITENPLIYGVSKYRRFLAAKLLLETLMTSGYKIDDPGYPEDEKPENNLRSLAGKLNKGLEEKLSTVYGMKNTGSRWVPIPIEELKERILLSVENI